MTDIRNSHATWALAAAVALALAALAGSELFWPWAAPPPSPAEPEKQAAVVPPAAAVNAGGAIPALAQTLDADQVEAVLKQASTRVDAFNIGSVRVYVGMSADALFDLVGGQLIVGQKVEPDPANADAVTVTKLYRVDGRDYVVVFRKPQEDAQYRVASIAPGPRP